VHAFEFDLISRDKKKTWTSPPSQTTSCEVDATEPQIQDEKKKQLV
jgi:hypothetical protein